jgi:PAS domain S-box-containing protein
MVFSGRDEVLPWIEASVRQAPVPLVLTDLEHRIVLFSKGAEELLGYTAEEIEGRPHILLVPADLVDTDERRLRQRVAEGEQVLGFATERQTKQGRRIPVEVSRALVRDEKGTPVGYSSFLLDQTEKKGMNEQLLLSERQNALARVVGKVFHELRTPLGVLVLQAEILSEEFEELVGLAGDRAEPALLGQIRDTLEIFTQEILRIEGLAEDYLLMIRPIRPHPARLRLGEFLETARRELQSRSPREGFSVRAVCEHPDTEVELDSLQMLRVFHNLAGNSLDAVPDSRSPVLTLIGGVDEDWLTIRLLDNGPGLPDELLGGGAFEIFRTTKRTGSGLGLHLVQEIILAHGGSIELNNHPSGGAEAIVRLPRSRATGDGGPGSHR